MFFSQFPKIDYKGYILTNITKRVAIPDYIKNNLDYYYLYQVKEGETIEHVAYKIYGDPEYNWVIILMNDIVDPFYDWVLSSEEIKRLCQTLYPQDPNNPNAAWGENFIVGYKVDGTFYDKDYADLPTILQTGHNIIVITAFDYFSEQSQKRSRIKVLKPEYLPLLEDALANIFKE